MHHDRLFTNGISLHYVIEGDGPLMLLLHGFPEFWYSWRHQIPAFSDRYKVVALDLRGYNDSDKPEGVKAYRMPELVADIHGAITALGYQRCILVGHDWGGAIAWSFVNSYPDQVEQLIVLNLPHPAKFMEGLKTPQQLLRSWYIGFFQLPILPELLLQAGNCQLIATMLQQTSVDETTFTEADLKAYKEAAAKPGALTAMINYYRNIFEFVDGPSTWQPLTLPTLMIWGEEDVALGKELTYGTEAYVKNLTLKYIPNCSHWVQQEKPQQVNQYINEFLPQQTPTVSQ
jgi:pimeloyl-ACP methyl ester carboxylesterase